VPRLVAGWFLFRRRGWGGGCGRAFDAVDGEHDATASDSGAQGPCQNVFVYAEKIAAAFFERAGGVGVMLDGVAARRGGTLGAMRVGLFRKHVIGTNPTAS